MEKQKISGYIMATIGLVMILVNAVGYVFHIFNPPSAISVLGIVFVAIGAKKIHKFVK